LREFALSGPERGKVTVPNLVSLMMYVEGTDKKVLLSDDGRDDEIPDGLWASEQWDDVRPLHVDILKIQHHGSINNVNANFCKNVIADHYVICGGRGGSHKTRIPRSLI
jgi:beta-lactamase superfamily II metal-dependent hydrolase